MKSIIRNIGIASSGHKKSHGLKKICRYSMKLKENL